MTERRRGPKTLWICPGVPEEARPTRHDITEEICYIQPPDAPECKKCPGPVKYGRVDK